MRGSVVATLSSSTMFTHHLHHHQFRLSLCFSPSSTAIATSTTQASSFPKRCVSSTQRALRATLVCAQTGFSCKAKFRDEEASIVDEDEKEEEEFVVVNFYCFVFIENPVAEVYKHLSFMEGLEIHGRIYINEQGINAQYSGPSKDVISYVDWLKEDERFSNILLVQVSPAPNGHAFPKLRLRYKPSLVQLEGGVSHLPLLDPSMRATKLSPSEWRQKLQTVKMSDEQVNGDTSARYILLDVRNGYEWDIGHFEGAQRPNVDCFRSTSFGISESEEAVSDPLADVDKEKTDILMYCTGGIRCDVYSTILRQRGFENLYTLEGGVSNYLKNEGPVKWTGNLFVFDSRLSLPPSVYNPEAIGSRDVSEDNAFARCFVCRSQICELRHRNCANIDCNLLFLCCADCVKDLQGCCCPICTTAPRLRPVLSSHQRYQKWHIYRDSDLHSELAK